MATETDAARDRVIAARADLAEELEVMEASLRAAVDIPARIRRSPAKVAAVVGGIGFLALRGPQRVIGAARRAVRGPAAEMPKSMLPDEIEKTLRSLGDDGNKVRGTLEREFAEYAKAAGKDRAGRRRALLMTAAAPLLSRGVRAATERLFRSDQEGFASKLAELRQRAERAPESGTSRAGSEDDAADTSA